MKSLLIFLAITGLARHDFHVSITNAEWQAPSQHLQISMKLFTDDLEAALIEEFTTVPNLGEADEHPRADSLIHAYLKDHFWLKSPAETFTYQMVGKEMEAGITFVYLQVTDIPAVKELQVSNSVFFDRFGDQSNIINVEINNNLQSAFLDGANPVKTLHFD